jgi:hypothetical protein
MRRYFLTVLMIAGLSAGSPLAFGFQQSGPEPTASKVLWERVNIRQRDLYHGPGGRAGRPDVRRVTLIRRETGGNNLKYRIRDASGRTWVAKIADESQAEVAAVRLLWAIGYQTEVDYLVPRLHIPGKRTYTNVRLEARPSNVQREGRWSWDDNPFTLSREFAGLRAMMALINNWDLKDSNNVILRRGNVERYAISDLGSSFGKMAFSSKFILNRFGRSVSDPRGYSQSQFLRGVEENQIDFAYKGKRVGLLEGITTDDARWLAALLTQLTPKQIDDAFRAANYTAGERRLLVGELRSRRAELRAAGGRIAAIHDANGPDQEYEN